MPQQCDAELAAEQSASGLMPRYLLDDAARVEGDAVIITGAQASRLRRVLRVRRGDPARAAPSRRRPVLPGRRRAGRAGGGSLPHHRPSSAPSAAAAADHPRGGAAPSAALRLPDREGDRAGRGGDPPGLVGADAEPRRRRRGAIVAAVAAVALAPPGARGRRAVAARVPARD